MIAANHEFQRRGLNALDEDGNEGCAACGRPRDVHPAPAVTPGQADEVPELFTRWYCAGWPVTGRVTADAWQYALPAERQFWRSLDAEHAAIAARQPQPAPGELPKGHFEHLQAIGVADNLRGQLHETRTALSTLLDRTEGTSVLTGDERDDYGRVLMKPHGKPQPAPGSASQVRRHAEQAAPGVCPRCGSQERTDRRQVRGFAGPTTACYSDWHDAGQPAPELAAYEVAIEQISRMCQRPKETAGTTQGVVVNGERLAGLILAVIKAAGLEGK